MYDLLVWADEKRRIFAKSKTEEGARALRKWHKTKKGETVELKMMPNDFRRAVPEKLRVGLLSPRTNKVNLMRLDPLH